jgi:hypothetical protein
MLTGHTLSRVLTILAGMALLVGYSLSARPALALQPIGNQINYYVNSLADTPDGDETGGTYCLENAPATTVKCTARAATEQGSEHSGPVIVNIFLPYGTISLTSHEPLEPGCLPPICDPFLPHPSSKNIIHYYGKGYGRTPQATTIDGLWRTGVSNSCHTTDILNLGSTSIFGVRLTGGCGEVGGAVLNEGSLSISASVITGNIAEFGGGGIFNGVLSFFALDSGLRVAQVPIVPNTVGMLNVTGTEISDNETLGWGGGILSQTFCSELCLSEVCIEEPSLCAYTPPATSMTLSNDPIHDNFAGIDGGGVYNAGGAAINGSSIYNNFAASECVSVTPPHTKVAVCSGGGVFNAAGATLEFSSSKLLNNATPTDGGGLANAAAGTPIGIDPVIEIPTDITVPGGQVSFDRSLVQGNDAGTTGGGIQNDGRLWLNDTRVLYNTAGTSTSAGEGGGIFSSDHLMITGTLPVGPNPSPSTTAGSLIYGNKAIGPAAGFPTGGGITAIDQTWITNTGIANNSATTFGGGIEYDTTTDFLIAPAQLNLQLQGDVITGNSARNGGGLSFDTPLTNSSNPSTPPVANVPAQGRLNNTLITANTASVAGGGIFNEFVNDVIMSGTYTKPFGNTAPSCPNLEVPCS